MYNIVGKSIRILSEIYSGNETLRFGLVDFTKDELIKETLVGLKEPKIVMIHNGELYIQGNFGEGYNYMYEFIQGGWTKKTAKPLHGRLTTVGLYSVYAIRETRQYQRVFVERYLKKYALDQNITLDWYIQSTTD